MSCRSATGTHRRRLQRLAGAARAARAGAVAGARRNRSRNRYRGEPRHVHAIPTSGDHKIAAAVDVFNASQHRRTVAGVARSLGAPTVNIAPDAAHPSIVWIVVSWELCWYRYEVDLSEPAATLVSTARVTSSTSSAEHERIGNASSDDSGALVLI